MAVILDYAGSVFIGGMLLLLILGFQATSADAAATQNLTGIALRNLSSTAEIIEYDFRKIGYRVSDTLKVVTIDSSSIVFKGDFDDNGVLDSIKYYTVLPVTRSNSEIKLYRRLNNGTPLMLSPDVNVFKLFAYDASCAPTTIGSKVRSIKICLGITSAEEINGQYTSAYWERTMKPNNLR